MTRIELASPEVRYLLERERKKGGHGPRLLNAHIRERATTSMPLYTFDLARRLQVDIVRLGEFCRGDVVPTAEEAERIENLCRIPRAAWGW